MKILHIVTGLSTGGAERALYNVLAGGLAERFDTAVVSLRDEGTVGPLITALGVPVYSMNFKSCISCARGIFRLSQIVRYFCPNLIQGWMYHGNIAASINSLFCSINAKVVWNIRQSLYSLKFEKCMTRQVVRANRFLSNHAEAVIYNSRLAMAQHEAFGFASDRSLFIPNGFDVERFRPNSETGIEVRQALGIPKNAIVIGHVARFHPMKDHGSFLQAAVKVARQFPESHFLVVGREVSLNNQFLANIVPQELEKCFSFPGERADVHRFMHAMDVLVTSSAWGEGFPNVLGEAMACGVPCVSTDVGDCREIVGNTGVLVPPSDSESLARGMLALLEMSAEDRRALGRAARDRVKTRYSLPKTVEKYINLYERLSLKE